MAYNNSKNGGWTQNNNAIEGAKNNSNVEAAHINAAQNKVQAANNAAIAQAYGKRTPFLKTENDIQ